MDKALAFAYQRDGRVFYFETLENILGFDRDPNALGRVPVTQAIPTPRMGEVPSEGRSLERPMNMQGGTP